MRFVILHESSSRIRIHLPRYKMTMEQADILEYYLKNKPFVTHATIHDRTGDASIRYRGGTAGRKALLSALRVFSYTDEEAIALVPEHTSRELDHEYQEQMMKMIVLRYASCSYLHGCAVESRLPRASSSSRRVSSLYPRASLRLRHSMRRRLQCRCSGRISGQLRL